MTDTILFNGRMATLDSAKPAATAVAIKNGLFSVVGSGREITALREPKTAVIDLKAGQ